MLIPRIKAWMLLSLALILLGAMPAWGEVVTYPAPEGEPMSADYEVQVDDKPVPVYNAITRWQDGKYSLAYFDFSGQATVKVKSKRAGVGLEHLVILPAKWGIKPVINGNEATFMIDKPFQLSFEPTSMDSPLLLFGNPIERDAPKEGDPNVVYFGPGVHKPGRIELTSGQTLYIAGGALVKGGVAARGDNIRIMGHGILDGTDWGHRLGPVNHVVDITGSNEIVRDIIIRGAYHWTLIPTNCDGVAISNVKICGSRVGNDDGINPVGSRNVSITGCFVRNDDDCIAIKNSADGIIITDCILWTDFANVFRIGAESSPTPMKNITVRNLDVIHSLNDRNIKEPMCKVVFYLQPGSTMPMENLLFENIRINGEGRLNLAKMTPLAGRGGGGAGTRGGPGGRGAGRGGAATAPAGTMAGAPASAPATTAPRDPTYGTGPYIKNITFRNIEVYGQTQGSLGQVYMAGLDDKRSVSEITFENVMRYGNLMTANSPEVGVGPFTSNVRFLAGSSRIAPAREVHVAVAGKDDAAGTSMAPFRTLAKAAGEAKPGDIVIVHEGVYRETLRPARGGESEQARITYRAAPGEHVTIAGSERVTSWVKDAGVWRADLPAPLFGNYNPYSTKLSASGAGDAWRHTGEVYIDGAAGNEQADRNAVAAMPGNWFAEVAGGGGGVTRIWANFGDKDPNAALTEINVRESIIDPASAGLRFLTFDGLTLRHAANRAGSSTDMQTGVVGAVTTRGGSRWVIENCTITDAKGCGICLGAPGASAVQTDITQVGHHAVRYNWIARCGQAGLIAGVEATDSHILGNLVEAIHPGGESVGIEIAGIALTSAVDTIVEYNCVRNVTAGDGLLLKYQCQNVRLTGNLVMQTAKDCLRLEANHGPILVENNIFFGGGTSSGAVSVRKSGAGVFVHNLFADCSLQSGAPEAGPTDGAVFVPHTLAVRGRVPLELRDTRWFNNVFVKRGLDNMPEIRGAKSDYNVFLEGAAKSRFDEHSTVSADSAGIVLTPPEQSTDRIGATMNVRVGKIGDYPQITHDFIGVFAVPGQGIDWPDGRPYNLGMDFLGDSAQSNEPMAGPISAWVRTNTHTLFEKRGALR